MLETADIRWKQRFQNYIQALQTMRRAMVLYQQRALSELEQQGLIQGFEFTHELAWNVLKDYLQEKGISDLIGSRDATRAAFKNGLIEDGEAWMDIAARFFPAFVALEAHIQRVGVIFYERDGAASEKIKA